MKQELALKVDLNNEVIDSLLNPKFQTITDSVIVTDKKHSDFIMSSCVHNSTPKTCLKLLYRATRDNWAASTFHAKCDN